MLQSVNQCNHPAGLGTEAVGQLPLIEPRLLRHHPQQTGLPGCQSQRGEAVSEASSPVGPQLGEQERDPETSGTNSSRGPLAGHGEQRTLCESFTR